jgi:predicted CopG family antitoxin
MRKFLLKTIRVEDDTHNELVKIGGYSETMDDIIKKLIEAYKRQRQGQGQGQGQNK